MPFPPLDPVTIAISGVTTSIRLFQVTYQLKAVGGQTGVLLTTVKHVERNINEALRLHQLKGALLSNGESKWMDNIIDYTYKALLEVSKLIEKVRIHQETKNYISLGHRAMWVLRDHPDVVEKHQKLSIRHQSLTAVISCLYPRI